MQVAAVAGGGSAGRKGEAMTSSASTLALRRQAADLCGLQADLNEACAMSEAYSLMTTGKHNNGGISSSIRAAAFYRALIADHVFRGRVMKWWLIDRSKA